MTSKIIVSESPRFDGSIEANSDPMQTLQKELERDISGVMQRGKCCLLTSLMFLHFDMGDLPAVNTYNNK